MTRGHGGLRVARVALPEGGSYWVRVEAEGEYPDEVAVAMDYGEDEARVVERAVYDRSLHGTRPPGFRLLRGLGAADRAARAANAELAANFGAEFETRARERIPDARVIAARLSLDGRRLFVRYATAHAGADVAFAREAIARERGVTVACRRAGPRDAVAALGGLGPCGRACCCSTWLTGFPSRPAGRLAGPTERVDGTCGRFRCCRAFEVEAGTGGEGNGGGRA